MTDYLDQVRHQLDQTRAQLRSAEDELAVHRQRASREDRLRAAWRSARRRASWEHARYRAEHLAATRRAPAGTPLICSDERHTVKVQAIEARRDELAIALREILATFVHKVHPGYAALQSQMIEVETVSRWRSVLAQPAPQPAPPTRRPDASSITDAQLDALYAELDRLRQQHPSSGALMAQVQQLGGQLKGAEARIASARAAVHIADTEDVTDWQRGYRACASHAVAALEGPVVDTCHTVTVDGETIRVRGAGPLGPVGEIALAEIIRAAKRRYAAEHPTGAPSTSN